MPRLPRIPYWFDGSSLVGAALTIYGVVLGVIGVAPMLDNQSKWWLFGTGMFLSALSWYALAAAKETAAEETRVQKARDDAVTAHRVEDEVFRMRTSAQLEQTGRQLTLIQQMVETRPAVAATGPVGVPLVAALDDSVNNFVHRAYRGWQTNKAALLAAQIGQYGDELPSAAVVVPGTRALVATGFAPTVTVGPEQVLQEIKDNPPKTVEGVNAAIERLQTALEVESARLGVHFENVTLIPDNALDVHSVHIGLKVDDVTIPQSVPPRRNPKGPVS